MRSTPTRSARRTEALSRERIITAAIEILDADGEGALTFRALAAALSTGAGAIYWHVANKNELLAAATDGVIASITDATPAPHERPSGLPREEIRSIALGLFDAIDAHPWVGSQLAQDGGGLANVRIVEAVGGRLLGLGLGDAALFDAATALTGYICGAAGQNAANARIAPKDLDRVAHLTLLAERWGALDETEFPFVRRIAGQLPGHDDREQFLAGVDLFLAGLTGTAAG